MEKRDNFILKLYQQKNTVFTIREMGLIFRGIPSENLKARAHYYAKSRKLKNVRRGIYTKMEYNPYELAEKIYTPSYISLETILQSNGIIFQQYNTIFVISYLTRQIVVDNNTIQYRRIKEEILLNERGIIKKGNYAEATKERAFLDLLYLYKDYYIDNLDALDRNKVLELLDIYQLKALTKRVTEMLKNA